MGEHCCRCRRIAAWPRATIKSVISRAKRIVHRPQPSPASASASTSVSVSPSPSPKPPSPEPNLNSPLIQLPVDILACVMDCLPDVDMHVLSVTCRALRNVTRLTVHHGPISSLSRYEYLCYLARISRNDPDQWVCGTCRKLHPAKDPMLACWQVCPQGGEWESLAGRDIKLKLQLQYRNVQRALKLERLGNLGERQRETLDRIMMPRRTTMESGFTIMGAIKCEYAGYPKIVQGRFLLLSVWTYHQRNEPISRRKMGSLSICYHQRLDNPISTLKSALETALQHPRTEVDGFCAKCPVDFSVSFSPERTTVHAWHDFGPEGSPLDPAWRVHFYGESYNLHDLTLGHAEGSVRELYESRA